MNFSPFSYQDLLTYLHSHTEAPYKFLPAQKTSKQKQGTMTMFGVVDIPLPGFKRLRNKRLANVIVPPGEIVYFETRINDYCIPGLHSGVRTTGLMVDSIYDRGTQIRRKWGCSMHEDRNGFVKEYKPSETEIYRPDVFSYYRDIDRSGLHFYLTVDEALELDY